MSLELEVRQNLLRLVDGDWTIEQFEDWFHPAAWEHDNQGVIAQVKLTLAEGGDLRDLVLYERCGNCDVPGLIPEGKTPEDCVVCKGEGWLHVRS